MPTSPEAVRAAPLDQLRPLLPPITDIWSSCQKDKKCIIKIRGASHIGVSKPTIFVFSALLTDLSELWFFKVFEVFIYFKVMIRKKLRWLLNYCFDRAWVQLTKNKTGYWLGGNDTPSRFVSYYLCVYKLGLFYEGFIFASNVHFLITHII